MDHNLVDTVLKTATEGGLDLAITHFEGRSPILSGSVHVVLSESPEEIQIHVKIQSTSAALSDNVRMIQEGRMIKVETGGLSYWQSFGARMSIEVSVSLPRGSGDTLISSDILPLNVQSVDKAGNLVLKTSSSPISIGMINAKSLTAISSSGAVTFEQSSEQTTDKFVHVRTSSSHIGVLSTILTPSVHVDSSSGSIKLSCAMDTKDLEIGCGSGSVHAQVNYMNSGKTSTSIHSSSGSVHLKTTMWSGFLTAKSNSGSVRVRGDDVVQINGGWRKGEGTAETTIKTSSGSIQVDLD